MNLISKRLLYSNLWSKKQIFYYIQVKQIMQIKQQMKHKLELLSNHPKKLHQELTKISKITMNMAPDQKMFCYLQQKIYVSLGNLSLRKNEIKAAFDFYTKSLDYGPIYKASTRMKAYQGIRHIFEGLTKKGLLSQKEINFCSMMKSFYKAEDRDFVFLIDSTTELNENLCDVIMIIKEVFFSKMKKSDYLGIYRFHEDVDEIMPPTKYSKMNKKDTNAFTDCFDKLKKNAFAERRYIYDCMLKAIQAFQTFRPDNGAKYLAIFIFGDNHLYTKNYKQDISQKKKNIKLSSMMSSVMKIGDVHEALLDAIEESCIHLLIISTAVKEETRIKLKEITQAAKEGWLLELSLSEKIADKLQDIMEFFQCNERPQC